MSRKPTVRAPAAPSEEELDDLLGGAKKHWDALLARAGGMAGVDVEWKFYKSSGGWRCLARTKRKNLVYLRPDAGWFLASFAMTEAAVAAAEAVRSPARLRDLLAEAPRLAEGWAVRVEVRSAADLAVAARLLELQAAE